MKKMMYKLLLAVLTLSAGLPAVAQETFEYGGLYYSVIEEGGKDVAVTSNPDAKYSGDIVIPSTVQYNGEDYTVTKIGNGAFMYCTDLTSVIFPYSVTTVGIQAFQGCTGLVSVTLGRRASDITGLTFEGCTSLEAINVDALNPKYYSEDGVLYTKHIKAIMACAGGKSGEFVIPDDVKGIGEWAFTGCEKLTSVTIPNSVNEMGLGAFRNCKGLVSVTIGDGITTISERAFLNDECLTTINFGKNVTKIGERAFRNCTGLTSVVIPNSVEVLEKDAFSGDILLASVVIGDGVKTIGENAFMNCPALASITISDNVTEIGGNAFQGCTGLASIAVGTGLRSIGERAFGNNNSLASITVATGNPAYCSVDNILYSKDMTTLVVAGKKSGDIVIPDVAAIGDYAFYSSTDITSVNIGKNVTKIGDYAFYNTKTLATVYSQNTTPPEISANTFPKYRVGRYTKYAFQLIVPAESVEAYKAATVWSEVENVNGQDIETFESGGLYYNILWGTANTVEVASAPDTKYSGDIAIPSTVSYNGENYMVVGIGEGAFSDCQGLTSIVIPNSVTTIGRLSFDRCTGLGSVTIPNSVTMIGSQAFYGCSALSSVTVGNSVTAIGMGAFTDCENLPSIDVDTENANYCSVDGVLYSKDMKILCAWPGGKSGDFVFQEGVTAIGDGAFWHCSGPTTLVIPNSVTTIGRNAFNGCRSLVTVTIGSSVTTIARGAFGNDSYITTLYSLNPTPPQLASASDFGQIYKKCQLIVPAERVEAYKTAYGWSRFENISGGAGTAISDVSSDNVASCVRVSGGDIVVTGLPGTSAVNIYTADGVLLLSARGNDGTVTYHPATAGIYIVRVGTQVVKVAVR